MLAGAGLDDVDPADALRDGRAMDVWRRMIAAQGGDPDAPLPVAPRDGTSWRAPESGMLTRIDALAVGVAAWRLGAGRARKEDPVSAQLRASSCSPSPATRCAPASRCWNCTPTTPTGSRRAEEALEDAFDIGAAHEPTPLVLDRISGLNSASGGRC